MELDDVKQSLAHLIKTHSDLYNEYHIPALLSSLQQIPKQQIYSYQLDSVANLYLQILEKQGKKTAQEIKMIVLLACTVNSWNEIFSDQYPVSMQQQFIKNLRRVMTVPVQQWGDSACCEDIYWKDLGLARQQLFTIGPLVVEAYSGFALKQGLSRNLFQSIRFLTLLLLLRGRRGYYQLHTHTPLLDEFNEPGWINAYCAIALMLKKNKAIKGVFGAAWYRDPQLENISPRLTYLRKIPLENGGKLFYAGDDLSGNAFCKSTTRLKLHKEGKYTPKSYLMVWPRKALIRWAEQFLSGK